MTAEDSSFFLLQKHVFILSSSGKPIFSKNGDEQELVTTFGLLQAIFSIVRDTGDTIHCINAGRRKIVYLAREALLFVSISSTGEPDVVLLRELEFMYSQVLLILTSKVHSVLQLNASKDLRDLLGPDTTRLMSATCKSDVTSESIVFGALRSLPLTVDLRSEIASELTACVTESAALIGLLMYGEQLLAYSPNISSGYSIKAADITLLASFVCNSSSLKSHDQNWVPICLPEFNSTAYLQAYIANFPIFKESSHILSLVLVCASTEAETFKLLHSFRERLELFVCTSERAAKIRSAIQGEQMLLNRFLKSFLVRNFFFRVHKDRDGLPPQYLTSSWNGSISADHQNGVLVTYYQHAVRMRCGASIPDCSLLGSPVLEQTARESLSSAEKSKTRQGSFAASPIQNHVNYAVMQEQPLSVTGQNVMITTPSSNHSLVYTCTSQDVVVGLASADAELHVCFPATMGPLDACNLANSLFNALKIDSDGLLQTHIF
jgi:hypothetical protein